MSIQEVIKDAEHRMQAAIDSMVHDFSTYRTGRANPAVLERVHVEYYGVETPLNQIANISVPDARQLLIQPYEKHMVPVVEKAIMKSDLGINPVNDGTGIRINFPQMNEERRRDMVKQVNTRAESACVAVRNVRRDAIEHLKGLEKNKEITQDDVKHEEAHIQKITDRFIAEVHDVQKRKDTELMEV